VTVITFAAGCSITSVATISTTGATCCFIRSFRVAFFTGARLGLALATVRFAALAALRTLAREADFPLGSFPRLCTFDPRLRLATVAPVLVGAPQRIDARSKDN